MHWIRHTTLTWGWNFGYAVAHAYAGHTDSGSEAGATATYVRASLSEVAAALAALTGEPHPLATTKGGDQHGCCHHRGERALTVTRRSP